MNVTKVSFTSLVIGLVLVVWVGVGVTGAVKAWGPVQQAEGARVEALIGEEVRHLAEMNRAAESEAWAVASAQAAAGQAWANAWRKVWVAGGWVAVAGLVGWLVGWLWVRRAHAVQDAANPVWAPAGPMLCGRTEAGRVKLLCQLTGAEAFTDDPAGMRMLVMARMQVVPTYLETVAKLEAGVKMAQVRPGKVEVLRELAEVIH